MEKENPKTNDAVSPFFSLLSNAEQVQIREVTAENKVTIVSSMESVLKDSDKVRDSGHSFFVHIRSPKPAGSLAKPQAESAPQRDYLLQSASILIDNGDFILAKHIYSLLLKSNIRDPGALKGLGICLLRLGEVGPAKKCFKAVWELYHLEEGQAWLGFCSIAENNDQTALEHFSQVSRPELLKSALRFDFHKEFGNCQTRLQQLETAHFNYLKALEVNPKSDAIFVNLGTLELQRQNFELAINHFRKAREVNPQNPRSYCGLGLIAMAQDQMVTAEMEFYRTLDIDSQNVIALSQLLSMADRTNSYTQVKIRLTKLLIEDPKNAEMRYALASCLFKEGNWHQCERELDYVLYIEPSHLKARKLKEELVRNIHQQGRFP